MLFTSKSQAVDLETGIISSATWFIINTLKNKMNISKEEFNDQFQGMLDALLESMAENADIDINKFYGTACFLENLAFFSPVLYGLLKNSQK